MSWWHPHPDAARVVRAYWKESELLIIAHQPPCVRIRDEELASIDRIARAADASDLRAWARHRRRSWMAAVLVCEGDDLRPLAKAVVDLHLDPGRFHFYVHQDAPVETLRDWAETGLPLDHVDTGVKDWRGLHKLLGVDFNVRIVDDFLSSK